MERRAEVRIAIIRALRSFGAKPGMTVSLCAIGLLLMPTGVGHGELSEALLSLLRDEVMALIPDTNSLLLLEAV